MKKIFCVFLIIVFVVILFLSFGKNTADTNTKNVTTDGSTNEKRIAYINSFGWEVSKEPIEKNLTLIPEIFSDTLNDYNKMQKESGFDLNTYAGKEITRFSYKLLNHPLDKNYARVNIFIHNGKIVAADVSSTKLDGFMHSIEKNDF